MAYCKPIGSFVNSQTDFFIPTYYYGLDFTLNANGELIHDLINWRTNWCKVALIREVNCLETDLE